MKKILITGKNSYVGNSVEKWLEQYPDDYMIDKISLRSDEWKQMSFTGYDSVLHVAGIAHQKETKNNAKVYFEINRDLAYEIARKAKNDGIKQFIFLSSMSVYGIDKGVIHKFTSTKPKSNYGKSKLGAENLLQTLCDDEYGIAILRPPMIYGRECKGNYQRLSNLAVKLPIFPDVYNERSMIYIDNLSIFIKMLIDNCEKGLFFPQNKEYVCTSSMVKMISEIHNQKIKLVKSFSYPIKFIKSSTIDKVFGNLTYEKSLSHEAINKSFVDFEKTLILTEDIKWKE